MARNYSVRVETVSGAFDFDSVGYWTLDKLQILKDYLEKYSQIMAKQEGFKYAYIDAFCGPGQHVVKATGEMVNGSPLQALEIEPPFTHYYLVDTSDAKIAFLNSKVGERDDVSVLPGNCNTVLIDKVFPNVLWKDYWRAMCFLDPYGLHVDWEVIIRAAQMRSVELFINFSIYDINLNVVRPESSDIDDSQLQRMDRFWGDRTWLELLYGEDLDLFGHSCQTRIARSHSVLIPAYRERLHKLAGFEFVPEPVLMKNDQGGILYALFFASHNKTADRVVSHIFRNYRKRLSSNAN